MSLPATPGSPTDSPEKFPHLPAPRKSRQGGHQGVCFDRALARDGSVDPTDKAVYAALASFIDPSTGRSPSSDADLGSSVLPEDVPTRKRLAECIGRTIDTVDRSIKRLEDRGLIRVHRRVHSDNAKAQVPSEYELLPHHPVSAATPKPVGLLPRKRLPISAARRARIMARDGRKCQKCGALADLTIDHIQHWSRGGTNADDNLRVLCRSCNSKRGDGSLGGVDA